MVCQVENKVIFDGFLVFSFEVQNPKKEKKYRSNMEAGDCWGFDKELLWRGGNERPRLSTSAIVVPNLIIC